MAAPDLKNEFNGVSGLLKGLFMWLFGMNDENGKPVDFMGLIKKLFSGGTPSGTPAEQPAPTPTQTATATTPVAAPQTAHKLATYGDSLAQGYGQGLAHEFGAANVANYGIVGAGLLGGTHLANVDWTKMKDTTVLISVGTNDVGFLSAKNPARIDSYAQQVVDIAAKVKANGGTPILVAMRAPDKPEMVRDSQTRQMRPQTDAEFTAWKDTLNKMNDAVAKAAAAQGIKFVTQEGGQYVGGGVHQTAQGYQTTADNALKQAGVTVNS
jgi:lysophospholipase L1-like esterase